MFFQPLGRRQDSPEKIKQRVIQKTIEDDVAQFAEFSLIRIE
jgi:hypothetical protein